MLAFLCQNKEYKEIRICKKVDDGTSSYMENVYYEKPIPVCVPHLYFNSVLFCHVGVLLLHRIRECAATHMHMYVEISYMHVYV